MFKQATIFKFSLPLKIGFNAIEKALSPLANRHCGLTERSSIGFENVNGMGMVHNVQGQWLLRARVEKRDLPASVVKKEVELRCKHMEQQTGRKPGAKAKKEIKEGVEMELLPKAFVKEKLIYVWIDPKNSMVGIEVGSIKKFEEIMGELFQAIPDLPHVMPTQTERSLSSLMKIWLETGKADGEYTISDECELVTSNEEGGTIKYSRHSLQGSEMQQFLTEGKQPSKLGLCFREQVEFIADENFIFKRIALIDFETSESEEADVFDATFFALSTIVSEAFLELVDHCGGVISMDDDVSGFEE